MSPESDRNAVCNETPSIVSPVMPSEEIAAAGEANGKQPHAVLAGRWSDGTLRPGFSGPALVHGAYARVERAGRLEAREKRYQDLIAQIGDASPIESALARLFVEGEDAVAGYMEFLDEAGGPIGTRGRQRAAAEGRRKECAQLIELGVKLQAAIDRRRGRGLNEPGPLDYVRDRMQTSGEQEK